MPGRTFGSALSYGGAAFAACVLLAAGLEFASAAQSDLPYPCQQIANQGRERSRQMRDRANSEYRTGMVRCRRNGHCEAQVKQRRAQAETLIQNEEATLARRVQDCQESYEALEMRPDVDPPGTSPGRGPVWRAPNGETYEARPDIYPPATQRPRVNSRAPRRGTQDRTPRARPTPTYPTTPDGDWDPRGSTGSRNDSGRTNQYGDWLPPDRSGVPCQDMIDAARARIRQMQEEAAEKYRAERKNCGRDLACHNRAKENAARRSREINEEQARRTREIRDCQAEAKNRSRSSGGGRTNQYGDWLPDDDPSSGNRGGDQCRGLIDYSRERIRKMQNEAAEDYQRERIRCAGGLDCLRRARERNAQRAREIKEEEARLAREIRDCQERNR